MFIFIVETLYAIHNFTFVRVLKSLEKIVKAGEEFPLSDPQHPDLQSKLAEIRTKFKQVI